jgi:hypothetical protein
MLKGLVSIESLVTHVKVWIVSGMPDYSNGKFDAYKEIKEVNRVGQKNRDRFTATKFGA